VRPANRLLTVDASSPSAIDAVPLAAPVAVGGGDRHRRPVVLFLFVQPPMTRTAGPPTANICRRTDFGGGLVHHPADVLSMVLAWRWAYVLAVMRLSPTRCQIGCLGVSWIFRALRCTCSCVLGLVPTLYKNIQLGIPWGPSLFHLNLQDRSINFTRRSWALASTRPRTWRRSSAQASLGARGQSEASTALGMFVVDDDASHRVATAMRVIIRRPATSSSAC